MRISRRLFLATAGAPAAYLAAGLPALGWAAQAIPFAAVKMVAGSPYKTGYAHGSALKVQIARTAEFYRGWLREYTERTTDELLREAGRYLRPLEQHCPQMLEEIRGIADGAGQPLEVILMINARTDLLVTAQAHSSVGAPGCTAFALLGHNAAGPCIALGQNWDWRPQMQQNTCLLRLKTPQHKSVVTLTEAGMVGKIGMNGHLGVCLNFLEHQDDDPEIEPGVPIHVLLRAVMDCSTLEQVHRMLKSLPRSASANFLVAEHQSGQTPRAWDFELTPTRIGILKLGEQGESSLYHTNHFLAPDLAAGCTSGHGISTMNRARQAARLTRELSSDLADPAEAMKRMLKDRTGAPYSISRTPGAESKSATLAGIVMDLTGNRFHLCQGPTHEHQFVDLPGA